MKKYDGEFPKKYFDTFLKYCNITEREFWEVIDTWRSEHIWERKDDKWQLRRPIWET